MTATVIDGKAVAASVRENVAREVAELPVPPGLATVLVGDDAASAVYVRNKRRQCVAAGMRDLHRHLPADISQHALAAVIDELNADATVTGILLQLPLPAHLDTAALIARIDPDKDVDGLTPISAGRLAQGSPGLRPCTPAGVLELLDVCTPSSSAARRSSGSRRRSSCCSAMPRSRSVTRAPAICRRCAERPTSSLPPQGSRGCLARTPSGPARR